MAQRALRKLQRQQEESQRLAELQRQEGQEAENEDSSEEELAANPAPRQKSAFELLNEADDEGGQASDRSEDSEPPSDHEQPAAERAPQPSKKKANKKKKKKKNNKGTADGTPTVRQAQKAADGEEGPDEIDRALNALRMKDKSAGAPEEPQRMAPELQTFYGLLSVESKNLNALNEMKKLFGSAVLESGTSQAEARHRGREAQVMNLETALAGRNSPASNGQVLSGPALRRNVFVQGKEGWPKASSGGLGMEIVEKAWDGTTEYKFMHDRFYRIEQQRFEQLVEMMDPVRLISNVAYHPYHIASLLQVAEIAKQQGDPAIAADLLERALFSLGRTVNSTFAAAMAEGTARLDFRRPENREFWLAASRYIAALGQRGTWRTAFEWSKLLLGLDPEGDPYRQRMVIDQLAIRGGQFAGLVALAETDPAVIDWGQRLPNIRMGLALAHAKLKHPAESRRVLAGCVREFPWMFEALLKELDIEPMPKSVWGTSPRTPLEHLQTAAYVRRAKDLWNTPETVSLLVEVVETAADAPAPPEPDNDAQVDLNDARHVLAADIPSLIAYLPRELVSGHMSASDPLPPEDNMPSYSTSFPAGQVEDAEERDSLDEEEAAEALAAAEAAGPSGLRALAAGLMTRFGLGGRAAAGEEAEDGSEGEDGPEPADAEAALVREQEALLQRAIEESIAAEAAREREREAAAAAQRVEAGGEAGAPADETLAAPAPFDPQAEQRWLAGRGLQALKVFCQQHGADEGAWGFGIAAEQAAPVREYAARAKALGRQQRQFILDYALPQGAGRDAGDMVKRMVG